MTFRSRYERHRNKRRRLAFDTTSNGFLQGQQAHDSEVYVQGAPPSGPDVGHFSDEPQRTRAAALEEIRESLIKLQTDMGIIGMKPLASMVLPDIDTALQWAFSQPVDAIIAGMSSIEHVETDAAIAENFVL
jgi:hypothetical protein